MAKTTSPTGTLAKREEASRISSLTTATSLRGLKVGVILPADQPKIHEPEVPLGPTFRTIGSPLYNYPSKAHPSY